MKKNYPCGKTVNQLSFQYAVHSPQEHTSKIKKWSKHWVIETLTHALRVNPTSEKNNAWALTAAEISSIFNQPSLPPFSECNTRNWSIRHTKAVTSACHSSQHSSRRETVHLGKAFRKTRKLAAPTRQSLERPPGLPTRACRGNTTASTSTVQSSALRCGSGRKQDPSCPASRCFTRSCTSFLRGQPSVFKQDHLKKTTQINHRKGEVVFVYSFGVPGGRN